jgi:MFS family permease
MALPKRLRFQLDRSISPEQVPMLSVLLAAGCLTSLTGGAIAPVFPDIVEQLNLNPRWAGTLVSMPRLTVAIASPLLGLVADRVGKLAVLLPSLVGFALFGIAGAFSQNLLSLLILRALVGVANGGISAASLGFVSHLFEGETRSRLMGYTASFIALASIMVPLLAGWLGSFHWRFAFCLYGIAFLVAIAARLILKEPSNAKTNSTQQVSLQNLRQPLQDIRVGMMLLSLFGSSLVFYTVIVYAPLYFQTAIDADSMLNGMILATRAIGAAIIAAVGATRLARQLGKTKATSLGFVMMGLTLAVIPFLNTAAEALITAFGFGLGFGIVMPNVYDTLADLASCDRRATLLALGTGTASLGQFLSPILLGAVWEAGTKNVFFVATAIALLLAILQLGSPSYPSKTTD